MAASLVDLLVALLVEMLDFWMAGNLAGHWVDASASARVDMLGIQ